MSLRKTRRGVPRAAQNAAGRSPRYAKRGGAFPVLRKTLRRVRRSRLVQSLHGERNAVFLHVDAEYLYIDDVSDLDNIERMLDVPVGKL